jgi:hypothetical protein
VNYDEIVRVTSSFDAFTHRDDARDLGSLVRRARRRGTVAKARRITNAIIAVAVLIVATIGFGLIVGPIGLGGLFLVTVLMLGVLLAISAWPSGPAQRPVPAYREEMSNRDVVQRLGALLGRNRAALPAAAGPRLDAIGQQLPLLEQRLSERDPLDPIAQDARRLMGQHLPELIDRYERVPAQYRRERDGDGLSVDERLVAGLDAARGAIDDLSRRLTQGDLDAFQTQGRFIESRYRDEAPGSPVP